MSLRIDANITLLLREQDVVVLLKAMQQFSPENDEDRHGREYLLGVLEQLTLPDET